MKQKLCKSQRCACVFLCMCLLLGLSPMTVNAADVFPGKPDGMDVSAEGPISADGKDVWLCSSQGGGSIVQESSGSGYTVYKAVPSGGYAFSHWATYYIRDNVLDSYEHQNPYDTDISSYAFSTPADCTTKYNLHDSTIQVNTNTFDNGRFYLYAVFVPGVSVSVTVENSGAGIYAYLLHGNVQGESYASGTETAYFGVAKSSTLLVQIITDFYTSIDKLYINGIDQTSSYSIDKSGNKEYLYIRLSSVQNSTVINAVTKPRECVVHFLKNDEKATGTMDNQLFKNSVEQILPKNTFLNEGYVFNGWNTMSDGTGTAYTDEEAVTLQTTHYEMDLYAQWKLPPADCVPPVAKENLVYDGSEQEIVMPGSTDAGEILYSLDQQNWSDAIPTGLTPGQYTVWYYVVGDASHSDSEIASVSVIIGKIVPTLEKFTYQPPGDLYYTGTDKTAQISSIYGMGAVTLEYYSGVQKLSGAPKEPGTYSVRINVAEGENYTAATGLTSDAWIFTISYLDAYDISGQEYKEGNLYYFKNGTEATVLAASGYVISKDSDGIFSDSIPLSQTDGKTVYLRNQSTGTIYPIDLSEIISFYATYTITFDANGGILNGNNSAETASNGTITLPADPSRSGYTFNGWYTAANDGTQVTESTVFQKDTVIYARWTRNYFGGGSSSTNTEITKNEDGSTTTTTTNKATGAVTETTKTPNGTTGTVVTDKDGNITEVSCKIPSSAAKNAEKNKEAVELPIKVNVADDVGEAVKIKVDVPSNGAKVEIPIEDVTSGIVVVIVNTNGTEEIVKTSVITQDGVVITLDKDATIKIIDNSKDFKDVSDSFWAANAIDFVTAREIFGGTSASTFTPNGPMTRQAMWMVLARMSGEKPTDMAEARVWAMTDGISDGSNPTNAVTRQQFVAMLWRRAQSQGIDVSVGKSTNILSYEDAFEISEYAIPAFQWACGESIVGGYADNTLRPTTTVSRAHVAKILMNFLCG